MEMHHVIDRMPGAYLFDEFADVKIPAFSFVVCQPLLELRVVTRARKLDFMATHLHPLGFGSQPCPETSLLLAEGHVKPVTVELAHCFAGLAVLGVEILSQDNHPCTLIGFIQTKTILLILRSRSQFSDHIEDLTFILSRIILLE